MVTPTEGVIALRKLCVVWQYYKTVPAISQQFSGTCHCELLECLCNSFKGSSVGRPDTCALEIIEFPSSSTFDDVSFTPLHRIVQRRVLVWFLRPQCGWEALRALVPKPLKNLLIPWREPRIINSRFRVEEVACNFPSLRAIINILLIPTTQEKRRVGCFASILGSGFCLRFIIFLGHRFYVNLDSQIVDTVDMSYWDISCFLFFSFNLFKPSLSCQSWTFRFVSLINDRMKIVIPFLHSIPRNSVYLEGFRFLWTRNFGRILNDREISLHERFSGAFRVARVAIVVVFRFRWGGFGALRLAFWHVKLNLCNYHQQHFYRLLLLEGFGRSVKILASPYGPKPVKLS